MCSSIFKTTIFSKISLELYCKKTRDKAMIIKEILKIRREKQDDKPTMILLKKSLGYFRRLSTRIGVCFIIRLSQYYKALVVCGRSKMIS
jgi:hypothetical protein